MKGSHIDPAMGIVAIKSLKKRKLGADYRAVPLPEWLIAGIIDLSVTIKPEDRIWPWSRTTGWSLVKHVMAIVGISGIAASPKGLRHSFGVTAICRDVPITLVQRWLGHASLETTAIYLNVTGPEERKLAHKMWEKI